MSAMFPRLPILPRPASPTSASVARRACRRIPRGTLLLCAAALLACTPAADSSAQQFTARVVRVEDGDTVRIQRGRETVPVRIFGIDAPERDQAWGAEAREAAVRLLLNESATVSMRDIDTYGRLVATLSVAGRDVGLALVESGAAWHYTAYSRDGDLARAEERARAARRGLWAESNPVPPWAFRETARTSTAPAPGPLSSSTFHGNRSSRVFHAPGCESYTCPNCTVEFQTAAAAAAAGYRPHAACVR